MSSNPHGPAPGPVQAGDADCEVLLIVTQLYVTQLPSADTHTHPIHSHVQYTTKTFHETFTITISDVTWYFVYFLFYFSFSQKQCNSLYLFHNSFLTSYGSSSTLWKLLVGVSCFSKGTQGNMGIKLRSLKQLTKWEVFLHPHILLLKILFHNKYRFLTESVPQFPHL